MQLQENNQQPAEVIVATLKLMIFLFLHAKSCLIPLQPQQSAIDDSFIY